MNARVTRLDFHCDVIFARPVFSRVASFAQIIEPIYDAFSTEGIRIPSDALRVDNGNSIATAKVSLSLHSGLQTFEARLDDYLTKTDDVIFRFSLSRIDCAPE